MPDTLPRFALAALFALAGLGAAHSSVQASSLAPVSEGSTCEAASSPYYCICCDTTGNASCCSKC
jgi:hypothetical protein